MRRPEALADNGCPSQVRVSDDLTHHERAGEPLYRYRYRRVLSFHPPGLAAALDSSGAFHIAADGRPAYTARYRQAFGFYEGLAAVESGSGWTHILPTGTPAYGTRYGWLGNFQEGRCVAATRDGSYLHISPSGSPAYDRTYRYVGDFREGAAVVTLEDGGLTHIAPDGSVVHPGRFEDLDVFHKGFAKAKDTRGWFHIDRTGKELYAERYAAVEPFYNGRARVQLRDGGRMLIDERGSPIYRL